jgi:hypothetical protein
MAAMVEEADSANNAHGVDEIFHARKFGNGESISRPKQPGTVLPWHDFSTRNAAVIRKLLLGRE